MPKLIRDGAIVEDTVDQDFIGLEQWSALSADQKSAPVQLEPGDEITPLLDHLAALRVVAINFPAFTDGRGFSYARELRERGYDGEIRAVGSFICDQLDYLNRCGFNAFQFADESQLDSALERFNQFSEQYQADIQQPQPLFRRRG